MKKIISLLSFCILFSIYSTPGFAQYYFYNDNYYYSPILVEAGVSVGAMNSLTDIGGNKGIGKRFIKDLNLGSTNFCGGVFISVIYKEAVALRLEGSFGKISANDNVLSKANPPDMASTRFNRNLSFRSTINEFSLTAEIHPMRIFSNYEKRETDPPKLSPYLLAGIGYYTFKPQTNLNGKWVDLQPLSTEGQGFVEYPERKIYKLSQMNFPVGAGFKYELSSLLNLRAEFVYRVLSTDYLDDLSTTYIDPSLYSTYFTGARLSNALLLNDRQISKVTGPGGKRGNPTQKDAFFSFNLKLSYTMGRQKVKKV